MKKVFKNISPFFLVMALPLYYLVVKRPAVFEPVHITSNNIQALIDSRQCDVNKINVPVENPLSVVNSRFSKYATKFIKNQPWAGAQNYIDYTIINLGLKPLVNVAPLRPEFGIVVNDVTAFKYPINIPKCRTDSIAKRTLFLGIWSAPNYVYSNQRKLICQTWLKHIKDTHYNVVYSMSSVTLSSWDKPQIKRPKGRSKRQVLTAI